MGLLTNYLRFGRPKPSGRAESRATNAPPTGRYPLLSIGGQYAAVVLGIVAQPIAAQARHAGLAGVDFGFLTQGHFVAAVVLSFIVFPGAYRPEAPSHQPRFLQFCVLFASGIGWQAIFDTVVK